jgi:hypothetical protein
MIGAVIDANAIRMEGRFSNLDLDLVGGASSWPDADVDGEAVAAAAAIESSGMFGTL